MNDERAEEERLRSVTLQNAQSIFRARQRAEDELVRTRNALWKESEWLRVTLASIGDAVVTADTEGRIISLNGVAESLTGWTQGEALGRPVSEVFRILDEETRQPVEDPAGRALRDGGIVGFTSPTLLIARNGSETPIDDSAAPIRDDQGRLHGVVFVFRSVAERRRAEVAQARLAAIVESSQDAIISKTLEGRIVSWNAGAELLFGYRAGEVIGQSITLLIPPERLDEEPRILDRLQRGERVEHFETVRLRKDGSRVDISLTVSPVRDAHGRIVGASKIARDITDRKRAQRRLETQNSITHCLAASSSLQEAAPRILEAICAHLGWQVGVLWCLDEQGKALHCLDLHHSPGVETPRLEAMSRAQTLERGAGIPGRVWAGRQPVWAADLARDDKSSRAPVAAAEGLHSAMGFPIALDEEVHGVLELFSDELRRPEPELIQMLTAIGSQIGQFVERRRAEAALREQENQLRLVTDTTPALISYVDAGGRYRFLNHQYERWFGHARGEIIGRTMTEVLGPAAMKILGPHVDAVLRGESVHFEAEAPYRDGGTRSIDARYVPDKLADGSVRGFFVFVLDVSERKLAEAALRRSEMRLRQLADAMPQIVWAAQPDGTVDYHNERWYEYTGFPRGEQGRPSWEPILHPDDADRCVRTYAECIRDERPYQIEHRFKDRRTGGYRWFLGRADPVRDEQGRVVRWFGTCTDIDDTKHAQETTRFLADATAAVADLTDPESTLQKVASLAVNQFADWCAVDLLEADGSVRRVAIAHLDPTKVRLARELDSKYPPAPSQASPVLNVIRTGQLEWADAIPDKLLAALSHDKEHLRMLRDLGLKSYICVPLKTRTQVIGAITFVTAESGRTLNAADVGAAEDLTHRVVIALENAGLLAKLREGDRRKDEFLAMLAHELRNPLAPIRNAVQIFRGTGLPVPELQWATEVIDRQVHQLTRLVDDLLDVSRITRGKIKLRRENIELGTVINSAVEASRPLIEKWSHELTVTIPPQPMRLQADPARLTQVFSNLLNNAAKYTEQRGRIWLTAEREENHAVVRVKDNGIGIPPEMLTRVFDLFAQVDRAVDRAEGGLGIGLTLVERLVEMHNGTVEASSAGTGQGSEFVVRLPLASGSAATAAGDAVGEPAAPRAACRMLVVDDNRDAADSLAMLLRMMGHEVHTAHDGVEAVGAAATFRPDVILLDIGLPKLNGYDAARRIREQEGGSKVILVALTGWGQEDDRRRSRDVGFDHHLTKPVEFDVLRKLLAEATAPRSDRRTEP